MNVHPEPETNATSHKPPLLPSLSTNLSFGIASHPKSPTSPTKSIFSSLSLKKSSQNMRPKSASVIPKPTTLQRGNSLISSKYAVENIPGKHHLGRSPSTPILRNSPKPESSNDIMPKIEDKIVSEFTPLPPITISSDIESSSSSSPPSSRGPSPLPSTTETSSPTIQSPSTTSISSLSETTVENDEEQPLDITTFLAAPRLTQRVRLKNGRVVSFSEVGDRNGFPVLVFLGMGCVRYFVAFFDDLASSYGLRLICPDRPGIGLSDNVKVEEQQVLKWPEVVEELCDILGINKFFIMAHSAGAPYALACALKMPERLQGTIYLVCPWVSTTIANNFKWLRYVPTPLMKLTNTAGISLQQMLYGRQPYATKASSPRSSGALATPMTTLEKKQQLGLAILKASFSENLAGANNDLLMCFERRYTFGFSYTDVDHPVHVFHGTKDERIPVAAVKWMEEEMPQCKLTLIEGGKHSLLLRAEVVDTIFKSIAMQLHVKDECRVCKISSKCWLMEESVKEHVKETSSTQEETSSPSRARRQSLQAKVKNVKNLKKRKSTTGKTETMLLSPKSEGVPKSGEKLVAVYSYF